ncbi:HK97 family phage portal protein [Streptosporangium becharense]|uniref:HK97 family phage portal protein n=2 Tax=Streptosporangium becharense TaxID=1816182 RepID=A0A7W9MK59_9ACTN|nr:HK97 family phage portal protein [Streptosporangium becharense]
MGVFWGRRAAPPAERRFLPPIITSSQFDQVDLSRAETSLQKVAVWSSVDLIASLGSELPIDVFRGTGADRTELPVPSWLQDPGADGQGVEDWIFQLLMSWLLRGNAVGIVRDRHVRGDFPTAVELLHPDAISAWLRDDLPVFAYRGREIPPEQLFFRRCYPMPGIVLGMSPIEHHASTIGLGIAITRFGRQWFTDGAHPGGMLTNTEADLDPDQARTAKERFLAAVRGTREPVVLGRGWNYQQIQIAPEESQFLESNQFTSAECARIFGPGIAEVLGYESGGSMTYSNVESRATHLLVYALNRWLRRVDRVLTAMLPRGQYARLNRDALLQSTTLTRYQAHEIALRNRWKTVNEVRGTEDLPPVPWGNEPNTAAAPASGPGDVHDGADQEE